MQQILECLALANPADEFLNYFIYLIQLVIQELEHQVFIILKRI